MKYRSLFILLLLCFNFLRPDQHQPKIVYNKLKDLKTYEGKIKLTLVREWGGEDAKDEAYCFFYPEEIKIDKDGRVYILDMGNCRIQIFDSSGKFIRTIGRKGQGPGDFLFPISFALDHKNNIVVAEDYNSRIQILDSQGNYINSFKTMDGYPGRIALTQRNEIAVYSPLKSFKSHLLLSLYNYQGKILKEIGKHLGKSNKIETFESIYFSSDNYDNFYVAYFCTPRLEKYSSKGELLMITEFETPFRHYGTEQFSAGLAVDNQGRIYLVVTTRRRTKKEHEISAIIVVRKKGRVFLVKNPTEIDSENTDLFRLLVLDNSGKVIASKQLDVFCGNIYVYDGRLYIVDGFAGMKIYEYKISFNY